MTANKLKELRLKRKMTLEELADRVGTSKQTIHRYENGVITNIPQKKIELLAAALDISPSELVGWDPSIYGYENILPIKKKKLPLLGTIACGEPIYAEEEYDTLVSVGDGIDADFCLRAQGDSMVGARIYDGDVVYIKRQETVDNGQIAAVIIENEATLKRVYYYPEKSKIVLSPENPKYAPLVYTNEELNAVKIIGKAVAFQSVIF